MTAPPPLDDPAIPRIDPVPSGADRPFWSVMIPSYNADSYLEQALRSVLVQDPGAGRMQIEVVDDASPGADRAVEIVDRLAPGRVEFHRASENLGLAGNWNRCLGLARGRWVHLLHQDDLVLPGFYERLAAAEEDAGVGAAFCQHAIVDDGGRWRHITRLERTTPGALDGWLATLSVGQFVQCPAIVVRRDCYEAVGGFRPDLAYALDWEMWLRVASAGYRTWFEPTVLACYRTHGRSETSRLQALDRDFEDITKAVAVARGYLPRELRDGAGRGLVRELQKRTLDEAIARTKAGDLEGGRAAFGRACRREPLLRFGQAGRSLQRWHLKLRARRLLGLDRPPSPGREALP